MSYESFSLKATNLKCFGEVPQGFDEIKTINLIVGRNNSGKSSLIDLVHQATLDSHTLASEHHHKNKPTSIYTESVVLHDEVFRSFPQNTSGGQIAGNHFEFGQRYTGNKLRARLTTGTKKEFVAIFGPAGEVPETSYSNFLNYMAALANQPSRNPLQGKLFRRLAAERDITPEGDAQHLDIQDNGRGVTNLIQNFLNKSVLPSALIEETLLDAINEVFGTDGKFLNIVCQNHANGHWEIYLGQLHKGRIALSQSGSGLKTIIQALCFIHLLPVVTKTSIENFIFAFEELENNLHPALQRRLLNYIAAQAQEKGFLVFLTTHSSVAIDIFNTQPYAQILHVTHDGAVASCKTIKAYVERSGVLDDLDVRASDLLQANGIIWVEGPSDRIYINRWIGLWSDGALLEGNHYQCVFYGGRLLAHLSGDAPDDEGDEGVSILRVNRHAIVVIDSDKRSRATPINATKKRVKQEIEGVGGIAWITNGREIENYLTPTILAKGIPCDKPYPATVDSYRNFFEYLDEVVPGQGKKFAVQKPLLAEKLCAVTIKDDLAANASLAASLNLVCEQIRKWKGT